VKLVHDFNVPSSLAAESVNMSRTTLQRATRAVAEEREIGRCGKPRILNEIENALKELPADTRITYRELRSQVRISMRSSPI
jgi:DNA-binding Lrp family transcriptional regulator